MSDEKPDDLLAEGIAKLTEEFRGEARHEFWHFYWPRRVLPVVLALILVLGSLVSVVVVSLVGRQSATEAAVSALRAQAEQSKTQGDAANQQLEQRGQAPVPIPAPGVADDMQVIVAAATARVLASLPDLRPTAAQLGQAVARYVAANPIVPPGPTPGQIAAGLAGYFATSPPPSGPSGPPGPSGAPGPSGPPGPAPTETQIQQAFTDYVRTHPDVLCPDGGTFEEIRVQLANGGSADTFTCVVATYPPPTSSKLLPIPARRTP